MKFSKLQATGNDFILVDARNAERNWPKLAQIMCRRHFGIGADGLILVQDSNIADLNMRMFNPDGSEAESCGNGLRCFTRYAIEKGIVDKVSLQAKRSNLYLAIETLSGIRKARAYISEDKVNRVQVNMGLPEFKPEQIPITLTTDVITSRSSSVIARNEVAKQSPIITYQLTVGSYQLSVSLLSMGNPHAVNFTSDPVANFPLIQIGPKVERHPLFPQKTNFEIARVLNRGEIEARVWEQGVGETLACGSGACAIAVAARLLSYIDNQVDIIFPGGTLTIHWDRVGEVLLTGPVEEAFSGEYPI